MKERPMLFSGPMVRAIIEGQKTVTRRVAKPIKHPDLGNIYAPGALVLESEPQHVIERACPYGQPGDRLWVRETWADVRTPASLIKAIYRADWPHKNPSTQPWKPSIHMPRWVSRILLEITAVRVERLHAITNEQCIAEGCRGGHGSIPGYIYNATPQEHFRHIWESTGGDYFANPWVWVVEFKRVEAAHG